MFHYTVGVAGHIDHGKTTLTKALTGIETDRLKEEKERQISIETGFAHFRLSNGEEVGVVDVPGHERFIRQMIAGIAGIDLVLLVVAANEGVMPQTREHLDILELLGVKKGIVVINKIDVVEDDFLPLVIEEVKETVQDTFLAHAKVMSISAKSGVGIPELVNEIANELAVIPGRQSEEYFRLPIDRAFTVKGSGTVVTGTVFEGKIEVGDYVRLLPQDTMVRVRGLQVHHHSTEVANAGQRTAINLSGIEHDQVKRGDVLLAPHFLEQSMRIDIEVKLLASIDVPLKHRSRISIYSGTAEIDGTILFFDRTELVPGESTYAQLMLEEPIVVKRGDPILLRRPTPALTLGGGRVINAHGEKYPFRVETVERLRQLHRSSIRELALLHVRDQEKRLTELQNELTTPWSILQPYVDELLASGEILRLTKGEQDDMLHMIAHRDFVQECKEQLLAALAVYHQKNPMQKGMKRSECREQFAQWSEELFTSVLLQLLEQRSIHNVGERLILTSFMPQLPALLQPKAERMLQQLEREGREVSDWLALAAQVGLTFKQAEEIRRFYVEQGVLINMSGKWVWTEPCWREAVSVLRDHCAGDTISIADVKEALGLSRKYIIPILEMMDQHGITKRVGETRVWKS